MSTPSTSSVIGSTAEQYLQALINLSPKGKAFPTNSNSNWISLLQVIADVCALVDAQACLLVDEAFPDTTTQLLPNWERIAGLPDSCSELGDTYEIRRLNLISKLRARGGQSIAYFIGVAAALGYTITITEFMPFQCGISDAGDPCCDSNWRFVFQVNAPLNTIIYFRAGASSANEPLETWGNTRLECVINLLKPAQTIALFTYS